VKRQIGKLILKRTNESDRIRKGFTLNNAQNVALVGIIEDERGYNDFVQRVLDVRSNHGVRSVKGIGFVNFSAKKAPDYIKQHRDLLLFLKSDLSWKNLPSGTVQKKCDQAFDLLLDVFGKECVPLEFLWRTIPASLKVSHVDYPTAEFSDLLANGDIGHPQQVFKAYEELLTKYDLK